jgi:hypothetical protein
MAFGVSTPTSFRWSVILGEEFDDYTIVLITEAIRRGEPANVVFNKDTRELVSVLPLVKIGAPTVIQGEPDPVYMAKKTFGIYRDKILETGGFCPTWDSIGPEEKRAWEAVAAL